MGNRRRNHQRWLLEVKVQQQDRLRGRLRVAGALALGWMPSGVGLLVAASLAMLTGALVEDWSSR